MQINESKKNMAVEGLRGLLIICIVLYHFTYRSSYYLQIPFFEKYGFEAGKSIGVSGFFVLSGYFLFKSLRKITYNGINDLIKFLVKKLDRLYRPYLVACLFIGFAHLILPFYQNVPISHYIGNFLLIRTFLKIELIDGAHWYFYALIQLSIIIPLIDFAVKKRNLIVFLLAISLVAVLLISHNFITNKSFLLSFLLGGLLSLNIERRIIFPLYAILAIMNAYVLHQFFVLLVLFVIPLVIFYQHKMPMTFQVILDNKFTVFIGTYSYMWYLIHQQFGYTLLNILLPLFKSEYLCLTVVLIITFLTAYALHKIVDCIAKFKFYNSFK